jgi:hypothetical protein
MKKIFLVFAALITLGACAAPPPSTVNTNANSNTPKPVEPLTEAEATAKEKAAWDAIQKRDFDGFANMLASDAVEINPSSINDKAATIASIKDFEPIELSFSDWKVLRLDNDAFVVTYSVKTKAKYKGVDSGEESARASSAWVNRDGTWVSVYHQETPIPKSTTAAPPPPAAKAGASPAASRAAPPVIGTPGPDAVANEKLVWDLFKARNYDAFASFLSDDFVYVEPTGVYDREGTVKMVQFDASKAELSEWKAVKLDDDASIVTYLVKLPGMKNMSADGERHATFWTRKDGKWLGRFHQGTPVVKETTPPPAKASPTGSPAATPKTAASPK